MHVNNWMNVFLVKTRVSELSKSELTSNSSLPDDISSIWILATIARSCSSFHQLSCSFQLNLLLFFLLLFFFFFSWMVIAACIHYRIALTRWFYLLTSQLYKDLLWLSYAINNAVNSRKNSPCWFGLYLVALYHLRFY